MSIFERMFPRPKDWGLSDNEGEFHAQLSPNSQGIVAGFAEAVEMTPSQIATRGRPGMVVKVTGTVRFGAAGSVDAPLSGMTCAWYRSYVMPLRHSLPVVGGPGLQPVPDIAPSDVSAMRHGGGALRKALRRTAEISTVAFRVADDDGFLEVDPRVTDVDTDVFAANQVEHPNRLDECLLVEWVLPYAQRVTVLGTLDADLRLLPGPDAALLVSTKNEQRILTRHRGSQLTMFGRPRRTRVDRGRVDRFNRIVRVGTVVMLVATAAIIITTIALVTLR